MLGGILAWSVHSDSQTAILGYLLLDFGGLAWNSAPVPQLLDPLAPSLVGCSQLAAADVIQPMQVLLVPTLCLINGIPTACILPQFRFLWNIPQLPSLIGLAVPGQVFVLDTVEGPLATDSCVITIG